jgi:hypothetical protein
MKLTFLFSIRIVGSRVCDVGEGDLFQDEFLSSLSLHISNDYGILICGCKLGFYNFKRHLSDHHRVKESDQIKIAKIMVGFPKKEITGAVAGLMVFNGFKCDCSYISKTLEAWAQHKRRNHLMEKTISYSPCCYVIVDSKKKHVISFLHVTYLSNFFFFFFFFFHFLWNFFVFLFSFFFFWFDFSYFLFFFYLFYF